MSSTVIDIPDAPSVTGFEHIRTTGDLSSVVLHRESFTSFEKEIIKCFPKWFGRKPVEWEGKDLNEWTHDHTFPAPTEEDPERMETVTEDAVTFIIRTFEEKLPTFEDSKGIKMPGSNLTVIDPYPVPDAAEFSDKAGVSTVMKFGDDEITHPDYVKKFGTRTSVHLIPPWFFMNNHKKRFSSITIISEENEWYTAFAYAQYLHRGGDPKTAYILKPSFRKGIDELARNETTMKHIMLGVALRVFSKVAWFGSAEGDVVRTTSENLNRLRCYNPGETQDPEEPAYG